MWGAFWGSLKQVKGHQRLPSVSDFRSSLVFICLLHGRWLDDCSHHNLMITVLTGAFSRTPVCSCAGRPSQDTRLLGFVMLSVDLTQARTADRAGPAGPPPVGETKAPESSWLWRIPEMLKSMWVLRGGKGERSCMGCKAGGRQRD